MGTKLRHADIDSSTSEFMETVDWISQFRNIQFTLLTPSFDQTFSKH